MSTASLDIVPVVTAAEEKLLDEALCAMFSQVSTDGPLWRTAAQREAYARAEHRSHLVVVLAGRVIGAVTWSRGQTPGFLRLALTSCHDAAWTADIVAEAVQAAMTLLLRGYEVRRVEWVVGTYNDVVLRYLTSSDGFVAEGVLRERFFLDGRYWPGVVCRADLTAFRTPDRLPAPDRDHVLALLRKKTLDDLTAAYESVAGPSGG